jgi:hypothetical protein
MPDGVEDEIVDESSCRAFIKSPTSCAAVGAALLASRVPLPVVVNGDDDDGV